MENFLNKLLKYYNLDEKEYSLMVEYNKNIKLIDPFSLLEMDKTVLRINQAIKNNEKIIIYGDYDCDGIMATSIMVKTFEMLNYKASYYIPSRYIDGYGLNVENVKKIAKNGFSLIITVDNGISSYDAIEEANKLGIDVIVIDHHEIPNKMVNANSVIHPLISKLGSVIASGGYMALFVSAALLNRYDRYLVVLAAISTISDSMELKEYNKDVVILGLSYLKNDRYLNLMNLIDKNIINEKTISLEIAPKINAIGRIVENKNINAVVRYIVNNNSDEMYSLLYWINETNDKRKELTKEILEQYKNINYSNSITIKSNIKEGMIGLLSNRLMNEYNVPTIVFTNDNKDPNLLKGSIRSKNGFNVIEFYKNVSNYLLEYGGHSCAGGLTINKADFDAFKEQFNKYAKDNPFIAEKENYTEISLSDINFKNFEILNNFGPFGNGNKEPTFIIKDIPTKNLKFISGGKHLSTSLSLTTKIIGFNFDESEIRKLPNISIVGNYSLNDYKGLTTLQFIITKIL